MRTIKDERVNRVQSAEYRFILCEQWIHIPAENYINLNSVL